MQSDAVSRSHWMTGPQFLDAVALGQLTPGPVVGTVAAVGYAAGGVGAAPGDAGRLRAVLHVRAHRAVAVRPSARQPGRPGFLECAGPAAIGAIAASSVLLAGELREWWQYAVPAAAGAALVPARRSIVAVLLAAAVAGEVALAAGPHIPG